METPTEHPPLLTHPSSKDAPTTSPSRFKWLLAPLIVAISLIVGMGIALAQDEFPQGESPPAVTTVTGRVEPHRGVVFDSPVLNQGDTLYLYAHATSGNLDPVVGVFDENADRAEMGAQIYGAYDDAVKSGADPVAAMEAAVNRLALAWDDDSGQGYDASLAYEVPADGRYKLLVSGSPADATFGDFEAQIGINAPEVLAGNATPTGTFDLQLQILATVESVQEITGSLGMNDPSTDLQLNDFRPGDTLSVFAEPISGTLKPVLTLEDFGGKPLAAANYGGTHDTAVLEYTFDTGATGHQVVIAACCGGVPTTAGDYRLLIGRNAPDVTTGDVSPFGAPIIKTPIYVRTELTIDQITDVDQISENFSVVANLRFSWQDPRLAFSPADCECDFIVLRGERQLNDYLKENDIIEWPYFSLYNQQGTRSIQNLLTVIQPDGAALYVERFTGTFQAPDFDFRRFPFDTQQFYIRVQSLFGKEFFTLTAPAGRTGFGDQLGEEEWIIEGFTTEVIDVDGKSQFIFGFPAGRHLNFYLFRIILPILLIILVSWFTFFLKDYTRRIEVTSGNLLIFIAYNFTISGELPRLGYLTLMDFILISTFVISALVIIINVWFRRMEQEGKGELANRIDKFAIWIYPMLYLGGGLSAYLWIYVITPYLQSRHG